MKSFLKLTKKYGIYLVLILGFLSLFAWRQFFIIQGTILAILLSFLSFISRKDESDPFTEFSWNKMLFRIYNPLKILIGFFILLNATIFPLGDIYARFYSYMVSIYLISLTKFSRQK